MSTENAGFERATLDRKDRAELASIAEALGRKPPSRSRKSEIVDMILDLAGVTDDSGEASGAADASDSAAQESPPSGVDEDLDDEDSTGHDSAGHESVEHDAPAPATPSGSPSTGQGDGGRSRPAASNSASDSDSASDSSAHPDSDSAGDSSEADAPDSLSEESDPEPANRRRRRRRGRDRDRDSDPEWSGEPIEVEGLLDLRDDGYGFLRVRGFLPSRDDVYVSVKQCRQLGLRKGDHIAGLSRPAGRQEKNPALMRVERVNGLDPEQAKDRPMFDEFTAVSPNERLLLTGGEVSTVSGRIVDLVAPIGKGQRGLLVTPPHSNKSDVLRDLARCIENNNPDASLLVLLIDEKPEEVSEFERWVDGDVLASSFDRPAEEHITVAELTLEHARRLVEYGNDVVILLDGLTRLVRAYNTTATPTGKTLGGTLDTGALYPAKWFFGSARSVEQGGSLTVIATVDVDSGSAADEEIFNEFNGSANSHIVLNRRLAERRVSPAIDMASSMTLHDGLLLTDAEQANLDVLRRVLEDTDVEGKGAGSLDDLISRLAASPDNDSFIRDVQKS